jgi:hypothetical protein
VFADLSLRLKCMLVVAAFVIVGLATWGIAQAADQPNVPATPAGMPPTAQGAGWAVVRTDGTLIRKYRVTGSVRVAAGHYRVTFVQAVSGCEYDATLGDIASNFEPPGSITVTIAGANQIDVFTFNPTGNLFDHDFHLSANC